MNASMNKEQRAGLLQEPELGFGEPWQAEAFATALQLSRGGVFSWTEWVDAFSSTIASQPLRDGESVGDAYYRQWMTTLESMLGTRLCVSEHIVSERQALWHSAYLNTRHGDPVALPNASRAAESSGHEHDHAGHHHHNHHAASDGSSARRIVPRPAAVITARAIK
ncbi:nitrile hydratase accessory protein [Caballeronia sp. 15711]|uniref:nitrile hydratase accessory protein n=1 Tax=Caballeronia sp. 15711 TaxID=3391029 RepID=UPI0039E2AB31